MPTSDNRLQSIVADEQTGEEITEMQGKAIPERLLFNTLFQKCD